MYDIFIFVDFRVPLSILSIITMKFSLSVSWYFLNVSEIIIDRNPLETHDSVIRGNNITLKFIHATTFYTHKNLFLHESPILFHYLI